CIAVLAPPAFSAGSALPPPASAGSLEPVPAETDQPADQAGGDHITGLGTNLIEPGGAIHQIRVVGTQRIEPETVLSYLAVQPGDPFDPVTADLSLKRLWATGLFADVVMRREGDDLVVQVVENPIINRIIFEGNHSKDDKKLGDEVQMKPRTVFTRARVQSDVTRIVELYRRSGRFAAKVTPKIVELPQNRVDLIFEISEGPVSHIAKINFIGNRAFTDRDLRKEIVTRESRIWSLFSSNDNYDPDRVAYDGEKLRKFYLKNGYADFSVVSSVAEMTPDGKDFIVTYTVDEGPLYKFGKVSVETTLQELDPKLLQSVVGIRAGETYNADSLDSAKDTITFLAGTVGYAFVDVKSRLTREPGKNVIDVVFEVNEGPRVYVERINIRGNTRTLDRVIRREIRMAEGDPYNRVLIDRSKQRLKALDFFKDVDIKNEPGTAPDRTILDVSVEEQPTGELSVGVGYSTDQFLGDVQISERNLLGKGQFLRLQASVGNLQQQIDLSFREPYFLDRNLQAGFDIYRTVSDFTNYSGYKSSSIGASFRTGFPLTEYSSLSLTYQIDHTNVDASALSCSSGLISAAICDQTGSVLTSMIGYSFGQDRRDDPISPTKGSTLSLSQDFAGVGGDARFLRTEIATSRYWPVWGKDVVLGFNWSAGYLWAYTGEGVRLDQRFFKGGDSFPGFQTAGIGPRDIVTRDALGGKAYGIGSLQLRIPTGLPKDYGIKAALFVDVGTLGVLDKSDLGPNSVAADIRQNMYWRASAGISIYWDSPFGPVRVDIADPFRKAPYDRTQVLRFSAGTRF
ncbi:MAG: outer membrane protein assembly factor BamA, partial [Alphaproteobacteria bacterium]